MADGIFTGRKNAVDILLVFIIIGCEVERHFSYKTKQVFPRDLLFHREGSLIESLDLIVNVLCGDGLIFHSF